jgi:hypothetical protein
VHPSGETVDVKQAARNAFPRWNGVAARNPYLQEATTIQGSTGYLTYGCATEIFRTDLPLAVLGSTTVYSVHDWTGSGSHNQIACFATTISNYVVFAPHGQQYLGDDIDWTMTHELGHGEGLGHTGHVAVMEPRPGYAGGPYSGDTPTSDDVAGLVVAYGAP